MTYFQLSADTTQFISNRIITPTAETSKGVYKLIVANCLTFGSALSLLKKDIDKENRYYESAFVHLKTGGITGALETGTTLAQSVWTPIKKFGIVKTLGVTLITCLIYRITSTAYKILNNKDHLFWIIVKRIYETAIKMHQEYCRNKRLNEEDTRDYKKCESLAKTEFERSLVPQIGRIVKHADSNEKIYFGIRYKIKNTQNEPLQRRHFKTIHFKNLPRNFFSIFSTINAEMSKLEDKHNENEKAKLTSFFITYTKQENDQEVEKVRLIPVPIDKINQYLKPKKASFMEVELPD